MFIVIKDVEKCSTPMQPARKRIYDLYIHLYHHNHMILFSLGVRNNEYLKRKLQYFQKSLILRNKKEIEMLFLLGGIQDDDIGQLKRYMI